VTHSEVLLARPTEDALRPVVHGKRSVRYVVKLPGSKSFTNRALIVAALAHGTSTLSNASLSDDSRLLIQALKRLGVKIEESTQHVTVKGSGGKLNPFKGELQVGAAGTTMRFLTSLCSLIPDADVILTGTERMHERPVRDLVETLQQLGADISYIGNSGCPPLRIRGKKLAGGSAGIRTGTSSQFLSALLLVGPLFRDGLSLEGTEELTSRSYVDMTAALIESFGGKVHRTGNTFRVDPQPYYMSRVYQIEGDASGASYFWTIAALFPTAIAVGPISFASTQGDAQYPRLLERIGCAVEEGHDESGSWIEVVGSPSPRPIDCDMSLMPDTAQTLAVLCAFLPGISTLRGLHTLKIKETDRLQAVQEELQKCGIRVESTYDSLTIHGGNPHSATIDTYDDHRMAMSFSTLAARLPEVIIRDPSVVTKSFPSYWQCLEKLGFKVSYR
jgi:3-phosphoshikimate 1-carboxyvinyltransferase